MGSPIISTRALPFLKMMKRLCIPQNNLSPGNLRDELDSDVIVNTNTEIFQDPELFQAVC